MPSWAKGLGWGFGLGPQNHRQEDNSGGDKNTNVWLILSFPVLLAKLGRGSWGVGMAKVCYNLKGTMKVQEPGSSHKDKNNMHFFPLYISYETHNSSMRIGEK